MDIKIESKLLVNLIGEKLAPRLVHTLIKDCLIKAIPGDKKDPKVYAKLSDLGTHFYDFMKV